MNARLETLLAEYEACDGACRDHEWHGRWIAQLMQDDADGSEAAEFRREFWGEE